MNAIPLINNIPKSNINGNEKQLRQEINTSLVALKKEAGTLEGLINEAAQMLVTINNRIATLENDTVKKSDVVDVVQSGNMNPVTSNAVADKISSLDVSSVGGSGKYISAISETDGKISATATDLGNMVPVDTVASGNMHSVTSNAVSGLFKLLWSNSSPSSSFSAQSISIPTMNDYSMLLVILNWATYLQFAINQVLIIKGKSKSQFNVMTYDNNASAIYSVTRDVTISNNQINITDGTFWSGVNKGGTRNDICIPARIYGIK
jgi:hypothetical protein